MQWKEDYFVLSKKEQEQKASKVDPSPVEYRHTIKHRQHQWESKIEKKKNNNLKTNIKKLLRPGLLFFFPLPKIDGFYRLEIFARFLIPRLRGSHVYESVRELWKQKK